MSRFVKRTTGHDILDQTRAYCDYLEEHLDNVTRAFDTLTQACEGMAWVGDDYAWHSLREQIVEHDLSKFSPEEFVQYRRHFFPISPEEKAASGFARAWEHHKMSNHHHHETAYCWADIVHMVVDWTAMGYKFADTAQAYYEKNADRINLSDVHKRFMYEIFARLAKYEDLDAVSKVEVLR